MAQLTNCQRQRSPPWTAQHPRKRLWHRRQLQKVRGWGVVWKGELSAGRWPHAINGEGNNLGALSCGHSHARAKHKGLFSVPSRGISSGADSSQFSEQHISGWTASR